MKQKKLSLANIQGKLSRAEMKMIMAGSGQCASSTSFCDTSLTCVLSTGSIGRCYQNSGGTSCYCGGA